MNELLEFDACLVTLSAVATCFISFVIITKRRDLIMWLPTYVLIGLSQIFTPLSLQTGDFFYSIKLVFSLSAVVIIIFVIFYEYYLTFLKKGKIKKGMLMGLTSSAISSISISVVILILITITFYMTMRIYLRKRKPMYLFVSLILVLAFISMIVSIIESATDVDLILINKFLSAVEHTIILMSGLIILIELRLLNIIKTSTEVSTNVATTTTELAANAEEINASSEEIAASVEEISQNTSDLEKSLSNLNEMAQKIEAGSLSLMSSSKEIEGIMNLIKTISDQTNLLALNASIEAGRAGEHGLGFSVVAERVQSLAEQSKSAVENIGDEIVDVIDLIKSQMEFTKLITEKIKNATNASKENLHAMESISASTEEQTKSIEEITSTANKLETMAQKLNLMLTREKLADDSLSLQNKFKYKFRSNLTK